MKGAPTAGPWTFDAQRAQVDCRGGTICAEVSWLPNGPLIAAAPDLFWALAMFLNGAAEGWTTPGRASEALKLARAALARARGETP